MFTYIGDQNPINYGYEWFVHKSSKEDNTGDNRDVSNIRHSQQRLIFTFKLPDINRYQKHCKLCRTRRFFNLWYLFYSNQYNSSYYDKNLGNVYIHLRFNIPSLTINEHICRLIKNLRQICRMHKIKYDSKRSKIFFLKSA